MVIEQLAPYLSTLSIFTPSNGSQIDLDINYYTPLYNFILNTKFNFLQIYSVYSLLSLNISTSKTTLYTIASTMMMKYLEV